MAKNEKSFLISAADFALYYDDVLACTGTTNLNTSVEVSTQEQEISGGKGNKLVYSFKYGRQLSVTLETANWDLRYIAAQTGTDIAEGLTDVYKIGECVQLTEGVGVLSTIPVGGEDVAVELSNGLIVTVKPEGSSIDLTHLGLKDEAVRATYRYNRIAKSITIDAQAMPKTFRLVLDADKHSNKLGKVGSIQIIIPAYQPNGNFTMNLTPDGNTSTNIDGKALAVEGDKCSDGNDVYAYIKEFDHTAKALEVVDIAATPETVEVAVGSTATLEVIGLKGTLFAPIKIDNADCEFTIEAGKESIATVGANTGVISGVAAGSAVVTVKYHGITDTVNVVVA